MKVFVLGASGYIGSRLMQALHNSTWAVASGASRKPASLQGGKQALVSLDTRDTESLTAALQGIEVVVNCVAGNASSISNGARVLVRAAHAAKCRRIVHLSSMSVYGPVEGTIAEDAPLNPELGWYGRVKCEAEAHVSEFRRHGGEVVMLRPGCVFGPGSNLWVGRVGRWLQARRLGDLGVAGDGWSNLVHVDDVCKALLQALQLPIGKGERPTFNLSAPDSPRWNDYFVGLALALGATPVRRIGVSRLRLDSFLAGPPLKIAQLTRDRLGKTWFLPDPIPPGLLRLWAQQIKLNEKLATRVLGLNWTPYASSLQDSASWLQRQTGQQTQG